MQKTVNEVKENQDSINDKILSLNSELAENISKTIEDKLASKFEAVDRKISNVEESMPIEIEDQIKQLVPGIIKDLLSEEKEIEKRKHNLIFYNVSESNSTDPLERSRC